MKRSDLDPWTFIGESVDDTGECCKGCGIRFPSDMPHTEYCVSCGDFLSDTADEIRKAMRGVGPEGDSRGFPS